MSPALRLYHYFLPYRKHLILSLVFMVLFALTSPMLIYLGATLFTSLFAPQTTAAPAPVPAGFLDDLRGHLDRALETLLHGATPEATLLNLCIALVLITIAKNLFFYFQGFFAAYVEQGITRDLREQIYGHLLKLPLPYFHRNRTGNLMSIAMNDVTKIHETFNNTFNFLIRDPLLILIYLGTMIVISWQLTLVILVVLPLISLGIYQIGKLARRYSTRAQEAVADISSSLEETINSIRIVKAYAAEPSEARKFSTRTGRYFRTMLKINRVRLFPTPINELLGVTAFAVILWFGGRLVLHNEFLDAKFFTFYLGAMFSIITPAKSVSSVHVRLNEGIAAAKRIFDLIDTPVKVAESPQPVQLKSFARGIRFDNVSFAYNPGEPVLENISLALTKGKIVALVGPSGSGKSTLIDLLCRFHDPESGAITIDGIDLRAVSFASLRGLLGVVTQETILFNDTVRNNIAYPLSEYDPALVEQAAKAANAHNFIMEMPRGYDTVIGNRGMMVSGGERQRLAIARALMKDPEILVFDEATSALDTESERLVQGAIDHLMKGRTAIVIAHRLSTILHADLILVLKDGRIVEQGRHEELLRINGVYRRLYDLQFERNHAAEVRTESA